MSAPAEGWSRLGHPEGNPIDADPDGVEAMSEDWRKIAEAIGALHDTAQRTQDSHDMQSDAFDETKKKGEELAKKLADYETRYEQASEAARVFRTQLDDEIERAEQAARKAAQLDKLEETETEEGSGEATPTAESEDQQSQLAQYKRELEQAVDDAQAAADSMESAINEAKKNGKDSCMDKFKAFLKKLLKVLMIIGMILSVIGLLIPGLNVIMIMGIIVDVVTMVFTTISFALGQSTVLDLVLGIVGVGLGAFSAFRSLKGLKVDAEHEGYAGAGKVRNGAKSETGGNLRRPIEMPSWKRDPGRARREAAGGAAQHERRAYGDMLDEQLRHSRLTRKLDEVNTLPPPRSKADMADWTRKFDERLQLRKDHAASVQRLEDLKRTRQGAAGYLHRVSTTSPASNAASYFFTKDWMRINRFAGRGRWLLSGAPSHAAGDIMTSAAGAPKVFPSSVKNTLWHGFLDRAGFRESRGFYGDVNKFSGRAEDAGLTRVSDEIGDLYFKADGRTVREPLSVLDPNSKGSFLGGNTDKVGWPFGNHDYLVGFNGIDSIRKTWGYMNTFGQMWEYGSPGNFFDPEGGKQQLTPWSQWKTDNPGNSAYSGS